MAKIHTLTYNGTKSSDLGVFVTGSGSFDAAELDVDKYEIPGRNGDLILSNNRYKNIEVIYPAFIPKAFMDKVQSVRNWLRSAKVYSRLEDTYDMDHFRMGLASGVQSFEPVNRNDGANFEMTFDCKPQRFLKVGETPETVEPDVQTASGEIVTFETIAESPMNSAEVSLSPIQPGSGDPSPTNIRPISGHTGATLWDDPKYGGTIQWNQLLNNSGGTYTKYGLTVVGVSGESSVTISGTSTFTGGDKNLYWGSHQASVVSGHKYFAGTTSSIFSLYYYGASSGTNGVISYIKTASASGSISFTLNPINNAVVAQGEVINETFSMMFCDLTEMFGAGNEPATVEEFRALFPLDYYAYNAGEVTCVSAVNGGNYRHYSVTFTDQGTVYGGTFDFVSGKLTVTMASVDLGTLNWAFSMLNGSGSFYASIPDAKLPSNRAVANMISSVYAVDTADNIYTDTTSGRISLNSNGYLQVRNSNYTDATAFKTAMSGAQLCYELARPIEYNLSAQHIETLLGVNNVWSDAGPITLTYAEPFTIENPTIFDARPLFTVTNPAEGDVITVNGQAITFVDGYTGTVFIDCETMNAYSGAANLNSIIEATDFPVLVPGTNIITWTGTGECTMTPRWWEL